MDAEVKPHAATSRTKKRSRSGAHTRCPHCDKYLRGAKGLKAHIASTHVEGK